jgi:hypothetical protein
VADVLVDAASVGPVTSYEFTNVTDNHTIAASFALGILPSVITDNASNVTPTSVTLSGNLTSLGTASSANVSFEYGLTTTYGSNTTSQEMTGAGVFTDNITGLTPGTPYHFRAKAEGDGTAYGSDMTFTTGSDGGGGSSSGGGGSGGGGRGVTILAGFMTPEGKLIADVNVPSSDLRVYLTLPVGTYCTVGPDAPFYWILFEALDEDDIELDTPEGSTVITPYYQIEPQGGTFDQLVTITFKYTDKEIPAEADENNLTVMFWDSVNEQWIPLETEVDTENNRASAFIDHLSLYTLMLVPHPAEFELSGLAITPGEVGINEEVTISVQVTNIGDLSGDYNVILKVNDETVNEKMIPLAGGDSEDIVFTMSKAAAGIYKIDVNGLSGELTVKAPTEPEPTQEPEPEPVSEPEPTQEIEPAVPETEPTIISEPETTTATEPALTEETVSEPEPGVRWLLYIYIVAGVVVLAAAIWFIVRRLAPK